MDVLCSSGSLCSKYVRDDCGLFCLLVQGEGCELERVGQQTRPSKDFFDGAFQTFLEDILDKQ